MWRWIALAIFLFPVSADATSIVLVRTPVLIVIAADSKPTYKGRPEASTVCKIYRSDDVYFAIAGLEHDSGRGFYPKDLVAAGVKASEGFETRVARAEEFLSSNFLLEMERLEAEDPDQYKFAIAGAGPQLTVAFAQMEKGVPYFAVRGFQYYDSPSPRVERSRADCPGRECPNGEVRIEYLGESRAIQRYLANGVEQTDAAAFARKLVELEIQDSPFDVGPPIALLRIDASGPTWISNDGGCPVITQ
jgi:hypothetical protein